MAVAKKDQTPDPRNLDQVRFCDLYALDLPEEGICLIEPGAIEQLLELPPQRLAKSRS
ncbi:MAG: hypothetical protein R3236_03515 [Phycisphaeraceae bacterium]|nr:hypothetical protein [Phycisphaeraceae bacterium]